MSTKAKYNRVRGAQEKHEDKPDTDILMKISDRYGKYVSRALTLFFGEDKNFVTIKAAERLIDKALWVAEVLRRKVPDLHQIITFTEKVIVDIYEPIEEGLLEVRDQRILTVIEITLTRTPTPKEKAQPGYHTPVAVNQGLFLTKETWQRQEKERSERREGEGEERPPRRDNRNAEERGGERRRGRGAQTKA